MAAYACRQPACGWEQPDQAPPNGQKLALLNAHTRQAHPEVAEASKGGRGKKGNAHATLEGVKINTRVAGENIVLPGDLFLPYFIIRELHPEYNPTKAEWLAHVVSMHTVEHSEEYGMDLAPLRFIARHLPGQLDPAEDPIEDPAINAL